MDFPIQPDMIDCGVRVWFGLLKRRGAAFHVITLPVSGTKDCGSFDGHPCKKPEDTNLQYPVQIVPKG